MWKCFFALATHIHRSLFFESNHESSSNGCGEKVEGAEMIDIGNDSPPNASLSQRQSVVLRGVLQMFKIFVLQKEKSIRCTCRAARFALQCVRYCSFMHEESVRGGGITLKGVSEITMQHLLGNISLLWLPTTTTNQHTTGSGNTCCCACDECGNHGGISGLEIPILWAWSEGWWISCNHHFAYVMVAVLWDYFREKMEMTLIFYRNVTLIIAVVFKFLTQ